MEQDIEFLNWHICADEEAEASGWGPDPSSAGLPAPGWPWPPDDHGDPSHHWGPDQGDRRCVGGDPGALPEEAVPAVPAEDPWGLNGFYLMYM